MALAKSCGTPYNSVVMIVSDWNTIRRAGDNPMATVEEIFEAATKLNPSQFARLKRKLDRLEMKTWETELARTSEEMKKAKVTDVQIDRIVMRRRRESRR